jgi:hypothetical protein
LAGHGTLTEWWPCNGGDNRLARLPTSSQLTGSARGSGQTVVPLTENRSRAVFLLAAPAQAWVNHRNGLAVMFRRDILSVYRQISYFLTPRNG